jgi:Serine phosphatase RsbU, regulator of sigma subunit
MARKKKTEKTGKTGKPKLRSSLVYDVALVFLAALLITGFASYFVIKWLSDKDIIEENERVTTAISSEMKLVITDYDSYRWVISYLLEHMDDGTLDLEYDAHVETDRKLQELVRRHPGLVIERVTEADAQGFSDEDRRLLAEIIFNRWLLRLNAMQKAYHVSYLYFFASDYSYSDCIYIVSANGVGNVRGSEFGEAYTLGTTVTNTPEQRTAFKRLFTMSNYLVFSDQFMDRYSFMFAVNRMNIVSGVTFDVSELREEIQKQTIQYIVILLLHLIVLAAFCITVIYLAALKPLGRVYENVNEYKETKDSDKIRSQLAGIKTQNEIGELAVGFSGMIKEIDHYIDTVKNVTANQERINAELNVAARIQRNMLPSVFPPFPDIKEFDVLAAMKPAKEVGGDFYDFFMQDEEHLALVIADVSGKGVPAAMFMSIAKSLIKNRTMIGGTPSEILYDVNTQLCDNNKANLFVTVWFAIINIKTGEGLASNAGHENPVFKKKDGDYKYVIYRHSLALGLMEEIKFKDREFKLEPGDRIFVYTDGVPESTNAKEDPYGSQRMLDKLNSKPDAGQQEVINMLKDDINKFVDGYEQFDDITVMVFDYYGPDGVQSEGGKDTKEPV